MSSIKLIYIDHPFHFNISSVRIVYQMEREFFPYVKPVFLRRWTNKPVLIVSDGTKYYRFKGDGIEQLRVFLWQILLNTRRIKDIYDSKDLPDFRNFSRFRIV